MRTLPTSLLTQKPPPKQGTACFGGGFYYKYRYFSDYLTPFNINGLRCAWLFQSISWAYIFLFMIYIFRHIIPAESYTFRHMPTANTYTFQHVTVLQSYTFRHIRPNKHGEIRRQRSRLRLIFCGLSCPRSKNLHQDRERPVLVEVLCAEDSAPFFSPHSFRA